MNGKTYESENEVLLDALKELKPEFYKTRGTLTVEKDGKTIQRFLFYPQMRKLFDNTNSVTSKIAQLSITKYLDSMLK